MRLRILMGMCLILQLLAANLWAQQEEGQSDSIRLYKELEDFSRKHRFASFIHGLIFKSNHPEEHHPNLKRVTTRRYRRIPYHQFEGQVIRRISIEVLDPFDDSIADSSQLAKHDVLKIGNALHVKSRMVTVRNLLLIRPNQRFDSLLVKESERLVREQNYVQDVLMRVHSTSKSGDSVDILIRVLDNWSWVPKVSISSNRLGLQLTDNNIIGLGHRFRSGVRWNHSSGNSAYHGEYSIPNIYSTHLRSILYHRVEENGNYTSVMDLERPFYSPLTKWAGGLYLSRQYRKDSMVFQQTAFLPVQYKFNTGDFWFGRATRILKGNSENARTTNLVWANRYLRNRHLDFPDAEADSLNLYVNEDFYLTSLSLSSRKYIQDQYIFYDGIAEDVPSGAVYGLTLGYQKRGNSGRYYFGARYAQGRYFNWGYFGGHAEYGSFFKEKVSEQAVFRGGLNYFTELFGIGHWRFRQFVKQEFVAGIHRLPHERLTLNEGFGLEGFNSSGLTGNSRMVCTFQTQSYAPWSVLGFHFGPYINYSFGILGDGSPGIFNSKLYSQIGLGLLIHNEHLIFSTFQLSISFFPEIPGEGADVFKFNSLHTADFGFRDFVIDRPGQTLYK